MAKEPSEMKLPYLVRFPGFFDEANVRKDAERLSRSKEHWYYALSQIRKAVYTNSSATIESPLMHLLQYERRMNAMGMTSAIELSADVNTAIATFNFNAQPFTSEDIYIYRQLRSEHLLMRMAHTINTEELNHAFSRLSRGIFLVQKLQPSDPINFPSFINFDQSFGIQAEDAAPVDTFTFDILFNDMMQQTQQYIAEKEQATRSFVPFTYTLGVRYTNPYHHASDIVVRGKIHLWCQTLFITECMRRLPILPNTTLKGLLPFLKDMEFRFSRITEMKDGYPDPHPEMTLIFERFAMELCDPQMIWQNQDNQGNTWDESRKRILNSIVICDIPDEQAAYIDTVASQWAMSQGILLQ